MSFCIYEMFPMDDKSDNVLTIEDLSAYAKIPKSTHYKLVREGKVLSPKVGHHLHFRRDSPEE